MAIYEQEFVRYDGPLEEGGSLWVVASSSFRVMLSFLRTKLIIALCWIPAVIAFVLIVLEYALRSRMGAGVPGWGPVATIVQLQLFGLVLLFAASGCGVVADDLRYRTFQLYFSKPLTRLDYAGGKLLSLLMLGGLVTLLPGLVLGGARIIFFARGDFLWPMIQLVAAGLGLGALVLLVASSLVIGLSSMTSRAGYVVLTWLGLIFVPMIISGIVAIAADSGDIASLFSLPGNTWLACKAALQPIVEAAQEAAAAGVPSLPQEGAEEALGVPWWSPFLIMLALMGAGLGAVARRVSSLEGVA